MIVPQSYIDRLKTIREHSDASSQGRLKAWANGLRMIADRPFTGVGYRNFHLVYYFYTPDRTEQRRVAHNSYVQITAESGIPAFIVFMTLIGYTLWRLRAIRLSVRLANLRRATVSCRSPDGPRSTGDVMDDSRHDDTIACVPQEAGRIPNARVVASVQTYPTLADARGFHPFSQTDPS